MQFSHLAPLRRHVRELGASSESKTKRDCDYAELCRIMRSYAFSGIMRNYAFSGIMLNYAFSGRIMHLHNRLSPGNKQLTLGE